MLIGKGEDMLRIGVDNIYEYGMKRNVYKKVLNGRTAYLELKSYERRTIYRLIKMFHLNISWQMNPGFFRSMMLDRCIFYIRPNTKDRNSSRVNLIHVWNQTCRTDKPWVLSLETKLPHCINAEQNLLTKAYSRYTSRRDIELIRKENCRKIICFCKNTYNELEASIKSIDISTWNEIKDKTTVLLPPQKKLIEDWEIEEKFSSDDWRIIFVGSDFWTKGGVEVILALAELRNRYDFKLTLVSTMEEYHQMVHNPYYSSDEIQAIREMVKTESWIDWYPKLDNRIVLKLMKRSHIGLFPSYGDTFGYVTLEMQASGCPVITTSINAMTEINNDAVGWVLTATELEPYKGVKAPKVRAALQIQITDALTDAFKNRELVRNKAINAADHIERDFSEDAFSCKMYDIYMDILRE